MTHNEITNLLKKEMLPALGCTGPTAYALATACCKPYMTAPAKEVRIYVSPAFLKIGFGVATPGTTRPGIEIAAAIGLVAGDWELGLQVLKPATEADMEKATRLTDSGLFQVLCAEDKPGVYVRAEVDTDNEKVLAVVEKTHDGVSLVKVNDEVKFEAAVADEEAAGEDDIRLTLDEIFAYVEEADVKDLEFLWDGYKMNIELAEDGIKQSFGLACGRAYLTQYWQPKGMPADLFEKPLDYLPDDIHLRARVLVSGASDGRMGGSRLPAMAAMGDGNQGLTAMLPVGVAAEMMGAGKEKGCRALAMSCLMLFFVKLNVGRASAFCQCAISAASGVAAGISYLKGMGREKTVAAVKNVIAPLAGMLCDGAKNGCALKMSIATTCAFNAVELAEAGVEMGYFDGVADDKLEDTVSCVTGIATKATDLLDRCMVDEIVAKSARRRQAAKC